MVYKGKINFGFLILHYRDSETTIQCVNSICKLIKKDIEALILIVDNGSNDGTGETVEKYFSKVSYVNVLILKTAYGFSRGNNIGYEYLKKRDFDFVIVANNDVIFSQVEFLENIQKIYTQTPFHVLGPDIYVPYKNYHDNPHHYEVWDEIFMEKKINCMQRALKYPFGRMAIRDFIRTTLLYKGYCKYIYEYTLSGKKNRIKSKKVARDACLSGACLIFSREYINVNEKLFDPETTFYCEEEILQYRCIKDGLLLLYDPQIGVIHNESVSTKKKFGNLLSRRKKVIKYSIESSKIYLEYIRSRMAEEDLC